MNHTGLYSPPAEHHHLLAGTHFTIPGRVEGWVDLGGWLVTYGNKVPPRESNPDMVTHPSTNRAQRRLTLLIKTNVLPLHQSATGCDVTGSRVMEWSCGTVCAWWNTRRHSSISGSVLTATTCCFTPSTLMPETSYVEFHASPPVWRLFSRSTWVSWFPLCFLVPLVPEENLWG